MFLRTAEQKNFAQLSVGWSEVFDSFVHSHGEHVHHCIKLQSCFANKTLLLWLRLGVIYISLLSYFSVFDAKSFSMSELDVYQFPQMNFMLRFNMQSRLVLG